MIKLKYTSSTPCHTDIMTQAGIMEVSLHQGTVYVLPESEFVTGLVDRKKAVILSEKEFNEFKKTGVVVDFVTEVKKAVEPKAETPAEPIEGTKQ